MRTERLSSLRSPSGINLEKNNVVNKRVPKDAKQLTVEYITNEVRLLGIHCLLWPALRPSSKYFVRDGTFGLIFQSKNK